MSKHNTGHYIKSGNLLLHCLEYGKDGPPILMLHSLSANAHIFQGLIARGLAQQFRLLIPDLRGRGLSSRAGFDYTLDDQCRDLEAILDYFGLEQVVVCGHSFGALLGVYFAAHYPQRVSRLVVVDAATELNPLTPLLINYATARLLRSYPAWDAYLAFVRSAPFMTSWDASMLPFLKADVVEWANGAVAPRNSWHDISLAALNIFNTPATTWRRLFSSVHQPALLLTAAEPFAHGQFIVEEDKAIQTAALMQRCDHLWMAGNHITMLFADGASQITNALNSFCLQKQLPVRSTVARDV
jgi:pimeloyl-ACP methyl ester carboxylesterase